MSEPTTTSLRDRFNRAAGSITGALGSPFALVAAVGLIVGWALSGPIFNFSESWQLIINTGTTIITFLMVFVIQASQNRDSKALHLKLDEVIRAVEGARNELIGAETSTEEQLRAHEEEFLRIAEEGAAAAAAEAEAASSPVVGVREGTSRPEVRAAVRDAAERQARNAAGTAERAGSGAPSGSR